MYIKNAVLLFSLIFCFNLEISAQSDHSKLNLVNDLKQFFSYHTFENAYLQFDKPYYAAGDTIYFKAYVTEGEQHQLSDVSGVLHVDLINPENKINQSIELGLDSGLTWGDFALPESLPAGNYRIRAYTQLMRNYGEMGFFDRIIPVGSLKYVNTHESVVNQPRQLIKNNPDFQFFPEGGNLVTDVRTKVGVKAIDTTGLGININGEILDNNNKEVCSFSTTHLGMGYFFLKPDGDKTYHAKVAFADGTQKIIDLPKAEESGITLSINNDSILSASVRIEANDSFYQANRNKNFILLIYSGGIAVTVNCKLDTSVINLGIIKRLLHSGIVRITLFSPDGEPLCERLLFVQKHDQLNLHLDTDKSEYKKREKVSLLMNAKNPEGATVPGHFSVSVIDESKVPEDVNNEHTILTNLLLTSELKGYVEQPNYYFNDTSKITRDNLDVLMLTQGYRLFEWKQVMDTNYAPLVYQPEKGLKISGKVTNLFGKPLANGTVTLIPSNGGNLLSSVSDNKGLFYFSNLIFTDTTHFVLSAINSKGRNSTKITYFNNEEKPEIIANKKFSIPIVRDSNMSVYVDNAKKVQEEFSHFKGKLLKPVIVKGKLPLDNQYRTQSLAGAGNADQVMHADEIERVGGQLSTSLNGRLRGVGFSNGTPYLKSPPGDGPMVVVIDGVEWNSGSGGKGPGPFNIDEIPSSQVETVEVLKYASASIYGMGGGNGVLVITTKRGDEMSDNIASVGVLSIAPMGFYKARKFYSPKYDYTNANSERPDLRSTIYWNPEIKTGKDGNASFDYYNADGTGTYKVTIEGIDDYGNIGRLVYRYKVE